MKHAIGAILLAYVMFLLLDIIVSIYTGVPYGFLAI